MLRITRAVSFSSNSEPILYVTVRNAPTTGFSDSSMASRNRVKAGLFRRPEVHEGVSCLSERTRASPALWTMWKLRQGPHKTQTVLTHSGFSLTRSRLITPRRPARSARASLRRLRSSLPSYPPYRLPSSNASTTESESALYAAVLRTGAVALAAADETAAEARASWQKRENQTEFLGQGQSPVLTPFMNSLSSTACMASPTASDTFRPCFCRASAAACSLGFCLMSAMTCG